MATSSEKLVATAQTSAATATTQQAQVHQPRLAEEISGHAEGRLHQRIGKRVRARQQSGRGNVDIETLRDHRDHGIDRPREQSLGEDHEGDDFQDGRNSE